MAAASTRNLTLAPHAQWRLRAGRSSSGVIPYVCSLGIAASLAVAAVYSAIAVGARLPSGVVPGSRGVVSPGPKLIPRDEVGAAGFGESVAVSADGRTALIGGGNDDHRRGAVWAFTRQGSLWVQQGKKLVSGEADRDGFGLSVALSGDGNTALIGEVGDNGRIGAAWVFGRRGSRWTNQGKLVGAGEVGAAEFGYSVALSADGNTALIGGPDDDRSQGVVGNLGYGAAWVFTRTGTSWHQQGEKLTGRGETSTGVFGDAVALASDGNTALVGAPNADGRGGAWVFTRTHSAWTPQGGKLFGSGAVGSHVTGFFGAALALSPNGNAALVSGPDDNNMIGAVWAFQRTGASWKQVGSKLTPRGQHGPAEFGISLALTAEGEALIGGWLDQHGRGAAWLFRRSGSIWRQQGNKITGQNELGTDSRFGDAVALAAHANTALVGGGGDNHKRGAAWSFG